MRRWLVAALWAGIAQGAQAADLPDFSDLPILRGAYSDGLSSTSVNWQGTYLGGQLGYSGSNMDFSKAPKELTSFLLQNVSFESTVANFSVLGKQGPTSGSFGGFVGWNSQWDDVVLGIEANYNHLSNLGASSTNTTPSISIPQGCVVPPPGDIESCGISVAGTASAKVTDVVTFRGRAGWSIDNFLPYMFGGVAVGRANIFRSVTITQHDDFFFVPPAPFLPIPVPDGSSSTTFHKAETTNAFTYGLTAGLGLEAMLFSNVFARGEYEYIKFVSTKGIDINMSTVRAGLGYKF